MAKKSSIINVKILGDAKPLQRSLGTANKSIKNFGSAAVKGFKFASIGAAAAVAGLAKIGTTFDEMRNTITKGTGATGKALEDLTNNAKAVMQTVPETAGVVGAALADVNTFFGHTGAQLEESTKTFLDFARVTGADVTTAVGALDAQFTQFGITNGDVNEVLGDLTRISQATGAPIENLLNQMETFGPIFANANFTLEETQAIFGMLEQGGVNLRRVSPALNAFFRNAAKEGLNGREELEKVVTELQNMEDGTAALNRATEVFGSEGAQRMLSAIKSGNFDLKDFNGLMGDGSGVVSEQAKATETLSDKFNKLKNVLLVAVAPLAEKVLDIVMRVVDGVSGVARQAVDIFKKEGFGGLAKRVGKQLLKLAPVAAKALAKFAKVIGKKLLELGKRFANFIQPQIVPALRKLGEWAQRLGSWILNTGLPLLATKLGEFARAFAEWVGPAIRKLLEKLPGITKVIVEFIVTKAIPKLVEAGIKLAENLVPAILSFSKDVLAGIGSILSEIGGAIGRGFVNIGSYALDQAKAFGNRILDAVMKPINFMGDLVKSALDAVVETFKSVYNALAGLWNNSIGKFSVKVPGWVPGIGGKGFDMPNLPELAEGGLVKSATLAVVGEAGPELVVPLDRLGDMGGNTINVYMPAGADGEDVVRALQNYARNGGSIPLAVNDLVRV